MISKEDNRRYLLQALIVAVDEISNARINAEGAGYSEEVRSELIEDLTRIRNELYDIKTVVKFQEPV